MSCAPLVSSRTVRARVSQHRHQRHDVFLKQRFATGNLHERAIEFHDRLRDFGERPLLSFVKGIFRVAISAAQIAESETHENARKANPGTLSLDRLINFVNRQRLLYRRLGAPTFDSCLVIVFKSAPAYLNT